MKRLLATFFISVVMVAAAAGQETQTLSDANTQMHILKNIERLRMALCSKDSASIREMFHSDGLYFVKKQVMRRNDCQTVMSDTVVSLSGEQFLKPVIKEFCRSKFIKATFSGLDDDGGSESFSISNSKINPAMYGVCLRANIETDRGSFDGYLFMLWEFPKNGDRPRLHVCTWQDTFSSDGTRKSPDPEISTLEGFDL